LLCYGCKQRVQEIFNGQGFVNLCSFCKELPYAQRMSMLYFNELCLRTIKETERDTVNIYTLLDDMQEAYANFRSLELTDKDCCVLLKYINQLKVNQKKDLPENKNVLSTKDN
jgi:hypothetical protein